MPDFITSLPATVSPVQLRGTLPPDHALEAQRIQQRQQIANLLTAKSLRPRESTKAGRFIVPPGWAQGAAQLGEAAVGAFGTYQNDKSVQDIQERMAAEKAAEIEAYWKSKQPTEAIPGTPPTTPSNLKDVIAAMHEKEPLLDASRVDLKRPSPAIDLQLGNDTLTEHGDMAGLRQQQTDLVAGAMPVGLPDVLHDNPQTSLADYRMGLEHRLENPPPPDVSPGGPTELRSLASPETQEPPGFMPYQPPVGGTPDQPAQPATREQLMAGATAALMANNPALQRAGAMDMARFQHTDDKAAAAAQHLADKTLASTQHAADQAQKNAHHTEDIRVRERGQTLGAENNALLREQNFTIQMGTLGEKGRALDIQAKDLAEKAVDRRFTAAEQLDFKKQEAEAKDERAKVDRDLKETIEKNNLAQKKEAEESKAHQKELDRQNSLAIAKIGAASREKVADTKAEAKAGSKGRLPPSLAKGLLENHRNLQSAQKALDLIEGSTVDGAKGDKNATGLKGYLPDALLQRTDPDGVDTRAAISNLGSLVIHDRSGAAVTAAEFPRLRPFIPSSTDDPATVRKKLQRFVAEYRAIVSEATEFHREQGYEVPDLVSGAAAAPAGGLSKEEQAELNELKQRFKK